MKEKNYKIIWVSGLFLTLILILILVMVYKIKYEDAIYYKYLYFYNCSYNLCSTINEEDIIDKSNIYSVYKYQNDMPTFTNLSDDYIIINDNIDIVLYDYIRGNIITKKYVSYTKIDNKQLFIASNNEGKYGIIDNDANVIVDFIYDDIKDSYNDNMIVVKYNLKYGVVTMDNKTNIIDYIYDDIYIYDNVIITIKDNILNIVDTSNKKLIDDIEISNMENITINKEDDIITIKVDNTSGFNEYKFDINTNKLV